jgi:hypothetical protein
MRSAKWEMAVWEGVFVEVAGLRAFADLREEFRGQADLRKDVPQPAGGQVLEHRTDESFGNIVGLVAARLGRTGRLAGSGGLFSVSGVLLKFLGGLWWRLEGLRLLGGGCGLLGRRNLGDDFELGGLQETREPLAFDLADRDDLRSFAEFLTDDRRGFLGRLDDKFVFLPGGD